MANPGRLGNSVSPQGIFSHVSTPWADRALRIDAMPQLKDTRTPWGKPPWQIEFEPKPHPLPAEADTAVIGGGFTGLAAAAWLCRLAPGGTIIVLESGRLGSGASGRTGGIALGGTAAGHLPGLGDVLEGFKSIMQDLEVECELTMSGAWEISHRRGLPDSPILWQDSGTLRMAKEVPGGTVDPGRLVSGLARAAQRLGAILVERATVCRVHFEEHVRLLLPQGELRARQVIFATNAQSLELSGLAGRAEPYFTLAVATAPLEEKELEAIGLGHKKSFYTIDLPYLWGRVLPNHGVIFGGGLVEPDDAQGFTSINVASGQPAELLSNLKRRVRKLHPALDSIKFTHEWGGPILFTHTGTPFFARPRRASNALVVGGFSGHGVALSVYLGCWAAEVLTGRRTLPPWSALASKG